MLGHWHSHSEENFTQIWSIKTESPAQDEMFPSPKCQQRSLIFVITECLWCNDQKIIHVDRVNEELEVMKISEVIVIKGMGNIVGGIYTMIHHKN